MTGAAGRTGALIIKELLARPEDFSVAGTVRARASGSKLLAAGLPEASLVEFDLAAAAAAADPAASPAAAGLKAALQGADTLVIATSGVPQIKYLSLIPVMLAKITGKQGVRPDFTWKAGQMPEQVREASIAAVQGGACVWRQRAQLWCTEHRGAGPFTACTCML